MSNNEIPIVVAPRPVRLSPSFFAADRIAFNVPEALSRASSRSALPSEALEEFLSILTPSFIHKPRSIAFPALLPDRNISFRQVQQLDTHDSSLNPESPKSDSKPAHVETDVRWFSSVLLSSPVSRMHTRNPFQRSRDARSPPPLPPLTPAAVPLPPSPAPDSIDTL
ncbi:hypothetical protein JR316_0003632 [Psilocybe cubensis]|uniref:Uncharacterized protein n=2 Tax=Psilocybe cubensis TaxID=181762 RepID=A0ACB8H928_PSICU|nr:hypothetical protein JR316_0003632 [Psilocybe cubensis]KAH9484152.1 hypothetical protein JR316_0003632 [Psilocybe cubensis]